MVALIVAYTKNRVIGRDGKIPWKIKGEQKRFKELTTGNVVVMGRRSYEEIGHPLPNRYNIVVSRTRNFQAQNCATAASLQDALLLAEEKPLTKGLNVYISGGAGLYEEAVELVDKMYITELDAVIEGDTYFPEFDRNLFVREVEKHVVTDLEDIPSYDYVTYTRKENIL
ncbi:MAG: dihydrofolate reductase [Candidatus Gastranaerophilales bacterium]|nr:dihydrofolate reductase [Candidatus Gastranaerophilales bacterium]